MNDVSDFDVYLQEQLQDPEFRERFEAADRALELTFQLPTGESPDKLAKWARRRTSGRGN